MGQLPTGGEGMNFEGWLNSISVELEEIRSDGKPEQSEADDTVAGEMDSVQLRTVFFSMTHLCSSGSSEFDVTAGLPLEWQVLDQMETLLEERKSV